MQERLDPKVLILFFLKNFLATFYVIPIWFIAVAVFQNFSDRYDGVIPFDQVIMILNGAGILFFMILSVACYYWGWLSFSGYSYEFSQDGLHINKGILFKHTAIIPYTTIKAIDLYINPLVMRFLGLYGLRIKTNEQSNTAGIFKKAQSEYIPGLTQEAAQHLRNELIKMSHVQAANKTFFDPISGKYVSKSFAT